MGKVISFFIVFIAIFIFYLIFVVFNKKKISKIFNSYEALILKNKFKVNLEDKNKKEFALVIATANAFICATAYVILLFFENIYLGFLIAAVALVILIFGVYSLIGYLYKKKEGKKDV